MKKNIFILMFLILLTGCEESRSNDKLNTLIYNKFFKESTAIQLLKEDGSKLYRVHIKGKDLNVLKRELKEISSIEEYSADYAPYGGFKEGFYYLQMIRDSKKFLPALYSISQKAMIVRKRDIYPELEFKSPNVIVLEFNLSKKAVTILDKYEKRLPNKGYFHTSWPMDYLLETAK